MTAPFDSHSVTVSSDALGTLVFAGEGGSSAATSIDTSAAGDIWDSFDGVKSGLGGTAAGAMLLTQPLATTRSSTLYRQWLMV